MKIVRLKEDGSCEMKGVFRLDNSRVSTAVGSLLQRLSDLTGPCTAPFYIVPGSLLRALPVRTHGILTAAL